MNNKKGLKAIYAVNKLGYIGLNGGLPWNSSEDLKHFRELTKDSTLVVGYNTAKTLPKLPNRELIIFDKNKDINEYKDYDWCIGGRKTYEALCPLFTELHISIIDDETIGDTPLPELKNLNPDCVVFYYNYKTN